MSIPSFYAFMSRGFCASRHFLFRQRRGFRSYSANNLHSISSLSRRSKTLHRGLSSASAFFNRKTFRNRYDGFAPDPVQARKHEHVSRIYLSFLVFMIASTILFQFPSNYLSWFAKRTKPQFLPKSETIIPKAKSLKSKDSEEEEEEEKDEEDKEDKKKQLKETKTKAKRIGFKERKINGYENRIRYYSTPDKIFRYFATLKIQDADTKQWEIFMQPEDFVRSITPDQPQPSGLGLDSFRKFDPKKDTIRKSSRGSGSERIFDLIGDNALISFTDYVFLLTVLATPVRQFELAFRMFDVNGDGEVDYKEFSQVQSTVLKGTSIGKRHRDHKVTGSSLSKNSVAMNQYFFGENLDQKLTIDKFVEFYERLHQEILRIEFDRYDTDNNGVISEKQFCDSIVVFARLSEVKKRQIRSRIKQKFKPPPKEDDKDESPAQKPTYIANGITFPEFSNFFKFIRAINDVDTALTFYNVAGAPIDKQTFKHVARTVAKLELSDHLISVVFTMFDEDNDDQLSNREFVSIMRQREARGLEKSKDTGFTILLNAFYQCGLTKLQDQIPFYRHELKATEKEQEERPRQTGEATSCTA